MRVALRPGAIRSTNPAGSLRSAGRVHALPRPLDLLVLRWLRLLRGAAGLVCQRSTRAANELLFLESRSLKRRLQMNVVAELVWSHQSQFLLKPAAPVTLNHGAVTTPAALGCNPGIFPCIIPGLFLFLWRGGEMKPRKSLCVSLGGMKD